MKSFVQNLAGYILLIICTLLPLSSCSTSSEENSKIIVTISPIKYIIQEIVGSDFEIEVLVPDGASPETYSPTSAQMVSVSDAEMVFHTGLIDFEVELVDKLKTLNNSKFTNINSSITLIQGECGHDHHSGHKHGVDPHIWTSPKQLEVMARNAYRTIHSIYPDSLKYTTAYEELMEDLIRASKNIEQKIKASSRDYFIIYHPALTYYARDYGVAQVSLEHDGKEPSATYMAELIKRGRNDGVKYILYQKQFSRATVESIAQDMGAAPIEIDPLAVDILNEILRITDIICE